MREISVAVHLGRKLHWRFETGAPKLRLIVKSCACELRRRFKHGVGKPHWPRKHRPAKPRAAQSTAAVKPGILEICRPQKLRSGKIGAIAEYRTRKLRKPQKHGPRKAGMRPKFGPAKMAEGGKHKSRKADGGGQLGCAEIWQAHAPQAMAKGYLQLHYTSIIYVLGGAALTLAVNRFYLIYLGAGFLTVAIAQIRGLAARLSTDHSMHSMIEHFEYIYVANVANAGMIIRLMFLAYAVYLGTLVAKHRKAMGGETP